MDLDLTLFIQLAVFCSVLVLLNRILLQPFQRLLERRHACIEGARAQAQHLDALVAEQVGAYESRVKQAKREASTERERLRHQGRERERELLAAVRADIAQQLNVARAQVSAAERSAAAALSQQTGALAQSLVEKVLGRKVAT